MDPRLAAALDLSNLRMAQKLEQQRLKDLAEAELTYAYNGGIFYIDRSLLLFANELKSRFGANSAIILDDKLNPVEIKSAEEFCEKIWDIYTKTTYEYFWNLKKLKQKRNVESVIGLND